LKNLRSNQNKNNLSMRKIENLSKQVSTKAFSLVLIWNKKRSYYKSKEQKSKLSTTRCKIGTQKLCSLSTRDTGQ